MTRSNIQHIKRSCYCALTLFFCLTLSACSGTRPAYLGTAQTALELCPSSPNCVSSLDSEQEDHKIEPFPLEGNLSDTSKLAELIATNPSAQIIVNTDQYIYAEYTSSLMGYVDDVEFLVNTPQKRIDVRSASRLGYSDLGANRKRIEALREQLNEK